MKVLVTGGAGFIGSSVVEALIEAGHETVVLDNLSVGRREYVHPQAIFLEADIGSAATALALETHRPDTVIHLAANIQVQKSLQYPMFDAANNINGTIHLLECCRNAGVRKIVYASSAAVYGEPQYLGIDEIHRTRPISFYGISKFTPEMYIRCYSELYGIEHTILRYSNVYGIRQSAEGEGGVISVFVDRMIRGERPVIYGDGLQTRDFVYVEDVARANLHALTSGDGETLNIGTGRPTNLLELYELAAGFCGFDKPPVFKPARAGDIAHSFFNFRRAREALGWNPRVSLEEGLSRTVEYARGKLTSQVAL
ncbi:NAD-dependent epimerase/dehydratase family protein [Cohnella caldifontis]|uniref:NAD-dependent epimerase/dehydratase family protein n=1 Tax=Cohnella caldifontis TaxID=3027471 RepID=UPI0023ECF4DB|nr:NAD-dependent epimerase/dehydratase family protein [Cohnella sp. YIM B05605]